jgi:DNA-binding XRE family transcriptional regulator
MPHNLQVIVSPSGEEMVVIAKLDYERLVNLACEAEEERADIEAYDLAKAEFVAEGSQALPTEVSKMLLNGVSLLKALHKWRRLTQVDLATKAGIQQGYLSDIESKRRVGSKETIALIAQVLDVPIEWIG